MEALIGFIVGVTVGYAIGHRIALAWAAKQVDAMFSERYSDPVPPVEARYGP